MAFSSSSSVLVPSLTRICVTKVVKEIKKFCYGVKFEDIAKFKYIIGPFENISSQCIEAIFEYVVSTKQLNSSWLSLLIVTHLRAINLKQFPSGATTQLFKILINRCQLLERLIIPNCKKIPNKTLCKLLIQNPSLLELDISNKVNPKVDASIVSTVARSCRCLTVLKLSDYRVSDPRTLLVLCGKRIVERSSNSSPTRHRINKAKAYSEDLVSNTDHSTECSSFDICCLCGKRRAVTIVPTLSSSVPVLEQTRELQMLEKPQSSLPVTAAHTSSSLLVESHGSGAVCNCAAGVSEQEKLEPTLEVTKEEYENQRAGTRPASEKSSDEDLYENDEILIALNVEDHSCEYGCLDLETLWLDNVNVNDQVMAVLLQYLPRLRDLNISDTDISNPWLLLDPTCCTHLLELEELDIKSTSLSRTALELIPKFHPDLHRISISTTALPPHAYANIGQLTGVADLELIGGQFYLCEPKEIFDKGIAPAIEGIGMHLRFLNLTYFAYVEFEVIPKSCPKLEHLDLSFTSITLQCPCESLGEYCPQLRSLNLAFCHIEANEAGVNPPQSVSQSNALQCMIGQPHNLMELNISGLAVGDDTLTNIFPKDVHPLQTLDLSRCSIVTIDGVRHVWSKCPFLHSIDLTYCRQITVDDLNSFETKSFKERPTFQQEGKLVWK